MLHPQVGQARDAGKLLPQGQPSTKDRQELEDENLASCPLEQDSTEGMCDSASQCSLVAMESLAAHMGTLPIKHPVFFPFLPPLTTPLALPVITSQINYLHSNPVSGSASGGSQTEIDCLSIKEESSPGGRGFSHHL